jgi:glycine cleavage system H lipoate-binding protein
MIIAMYLINGLANKIRSIKMVIILMFFTVAVFITVGYFLNRENRIIAEKDKSRKTPIFMSPDKALLPLRANESRRFHVSHTWTQRSDGETIHVGFDGLIPYIFSGKINLEDLPQSGKYVNQGDRIWRIEQGKRSVYQAAPVSGIVAEVNPALSVGVPIESDRIQNSWIMKIEPVNGQDELKNLMNENQAALINRATRDQISEELHASAYMNDGGVIDANYLDSINTDDWDQFIRRHFPY